MFVSTNKVGVIMKDMVKTTKRKDALTLSLTALSSGVIWFYTGPIASVAARESFSLGYDFLYGVPHWYNPSYALTYMPLREHAGHYGYQYGGLMLGSLCAPFIYKGIHAATNLGGKILSTLGFLAVKQEEEEPKCAVISDKADRPPIPALQFSMQTKPLSLKEAIRSKENKADQEDEDTHHLTIESVNLGHSSSRL